MSRIGKKPIILPESVRIDLLDDKIQVKGKYGILEHFLPACLLLNIEKNKIILSTKDDTRESRRFHGLTRALLANMINGVERKFSKILLAEGVGYKFQLEKNNLVLNVGFSHPVKLEVPVDLEVKVESAVKISITGIKKERVGFFADKIRSIQPPEPYKGKGIFYEGETIRRKAGKTGK
jgi:large subunit ribosomal protein L6